MPDGRAPREGEVFRNPDLARTLRAIAEGGRDAFYRGAIAKTIVAFSRSNGGLLRARRTSPPTRPTGSSRLHRLPRLRRLGAAAERPGHRRAADAERARAFDLKGMGRDSADFWHLLDRGQEARLRGPRPLLRRSRRSTRSRSPACSRKDYAASARALIDPARAATTARAPATRARDGDTIYLTVADARRQHGLAHPEQLPRLRLRARRPTASASRSRTAARCSPSTRATPNALRAGQAAVPHDHPRASSRRTASPG